MHSYRKIISIVCFILLIVSVPTHAERYKILHINSGGVQIGSLTLKVGDTFDGTQIIIWNDDRQAIKVLNLDTQKVMVITAKGFEKSKAKSINEYLIGVKHLSVRGFQPIQPKDSILNDTLSQRTNNPPTDSKKIY